MNTKNDLNNAFINDEQNLRLLVNYSEDPLWLVDKNCTILECNRAFHIWVSSFLGVPLQKGDNILYNGKDKMYNDKFEMCYKLALNGRDFTTVEDMVINGETHFTSVSFNPALDENGNVYAISCCARDITEQRKHLFHIEQQNAALREIAFIQSHKIRGPVATIMGLEQLFNYADCLDPINKEIMDGIKQMSLDLDVMIRKVVRMSNEIDS